jgi:ribA/ribD-fused uncharacterized protein
MERKVHKFYGHTLKNGPDRWFSNFSDNPITISDATGTKTYPTSEHYFQAMKFIQYPDYMEKIRLTKSPYYAKQMGGDRTHKLRDDWETVKEEVMLTALRAKFTQHQELHQHLLSTGDDFLVENAPNDYYWGIGAKGTGLNRLGHCLMIVRDELRKK